MDMCGHQGQLDNVECWTSLDRQKEVICGDLRLKQHLQRIESCRSEVRLCN